MNKEIALTMKIAVIGAGAAGIVAIKYCVQDGYHCEAFEQTENIGGTWNYTDDVGFDKNGLPIHTSMYKNLRTNLPKELMTFEGFPFPEDLKESYILQDEVLKYLNQYVDEMKLRKYIKFLTQVTNVEPLDNNKWKIEVQDVITKNRESKIFDAVICCNGKYSVPYLPEIPGLDSFTGNCIHSHNYRTEEPYRDKTVMVIGGGPSGVDICNRLNKVAKKVLCSLKDTSVGFVLPEGVTEKALVEKVEGCDIFFQDGSVEDDIEEIILCTGYVTSFPFLSPKCEVTVEDNYIPCLYKELINTNHPTMAFLWIPASTCPIPTCEIQMRFFLATLNGHFSLPSKKEMLFDAELHRKRRGVKNRLVHDKATGNLEREYYDDLAETAKVRPVPLSVTDLHNNVKKCRKFSRC